MDNWIIQLSSKSNPHSYYGANVDADQGLWTKLLATKMASFVELSKVGKKDKKGKKDTQSSSALPHIIVEITNGMQSIFCIKAHNPLFCKQMPADPTAACHRFTEKKVCLGRAQKWHHSHKYVCTGKKCEHCQVKHLSNFHIPLTTYRKSQQGKQSKNKMKRKAKKKQEIPSGSQDEASPQTSLMALAAKVGTTKPDAPKGLLRTCFAYACGPNDNRRQVRICFDSGSQVCMITSKVAADLNLPGQEKPLQFQSEGQRDNALPSQEVQFVLQSLYGEYTSPTLRAATIKQIAGDIDPVTS